MKVNEENLESERNLKNKFGEERNFGKKNNKNSDIINKTALTTLVMKVTSETIALVK